MISIKPYTNNEYPAIKNLYKGSGWYDSETDSEERINTQIAQEPNSILIAVENDKIIGTVTLLFTPRLGLFFRLIAEEKEARTELIKKGFEIFKEKSYKEAHIISPEQDLERQTEYEEIGFQKGKSYRWYWKTI